MFTNILVFLKKNNMKYFSKILFLPILLLFINSCEVENFLTDDELIDAIINSEEKISVLENEEELFTEAIYISSVTFL